MKKAACGTAICGLAIKVIGGKKPRGEESARTWSVPLYSSGRCCEDVVSGQTQGKKGGEIKVKVVGRMGGREKALRWSVMLVRRGDRE